MIKYKSKYDHVQMCKYACNTKTTTKQHTLKPVVWLPSLKYATGSRDSWAIRNLVFSSQFSFWKGLALRLPSGSWIHRGQGTFADCRKRPCSSSLHCEKVRGNCSAVPFMRLLWRPVVSFCNTMSGSPLIPSWQICASPPPGGALTAWIMATGSPNVRSRWCDI